jgi:hypothetical protein
MNTYVHTYVGKRKRCPYMGTMLSIKTNEKKLRQFYNILKSLPGFF